MKLIHLSDRFRKAAKIILAIIVVTAILVSIVHLLIKAIFIPPYRATDFNTYKSDLDKIAVSLWDEYRPILKENDSISHIALYPNSDDWEIFYAKKAVDGRENVGTEPMNKDIKPYISSLYKVLPPDSEGYGHFDGIRISKDRIAFVRCGGHYALVYTKLTRPYFISNKGERCFTDRISFNWYQVVNYDGSPAKAP